MGLRLKFRFSTLHLMDVSSQTSALFRYLLPLRIIPSALRLFLLMFLCFSLIPSAAGDIAHHGSSTIVYNEATHHGKALDKVAMSAGGVRALASKLYYPSYLRVRPAIADNRTVVIVAVNANGRVAAVSFSPPIHESLEAVVVKAVYSTQWIPATKNNVPVPSRLRIPINFKTVKYK